MRRRGVSSTTRRRRPRDGEIARISSVGCRLGKRSAGEQRVHDLLDPGVSASVRHLGASRFRAPARADALAVWK